MLLSFALQAKAEGERFAAFHQICERQGMMNDSVLQFLNQWEKDEPNNAEMYYCYYLFHFFKAEPQIEVNDELTVEALDNTAMLPDTLTRFKDLKIKNFRILKDKGDGMENYNKAIAYIQKAISLNPNILELYTNLCDGFLRKYEFKYAAAMALDIIDMHRQNPNRWTDFYGNSYGEQTDLVIQASICNDVIGKLLESMELELAHIVIDSLISLYPEVPECRIQKGIIYLQSYQMDKALEYFLSLYQNYPSNDNLLYYLAALYDQKGDEENTKKYATLLSQSNDPGLAAYGRQFLDKFETFCIDFEAIKEWMAEHRADYDQLEARFREGDVNMSMTDLSRLYFGHALTERCQGTELWPVSLDSLFKAQDFAHCLAESQKCLEQHPASIAALFFAVVSMQNSNPGEEMMPIIERYAMQLVAIVKMIRKDADDVAEGKAKDTMMEGLGHKYYKILWRADEDAYVDYLMAPEERNQTLLFSNPGYFH